jgi:acyl-ACP thioesterase
VSLAKGAFSLKASEGLQKIDTRRVRCSDIDGNNHVNNVRYIEWIQDAAEFDKINDAASVRLDMNYISERKYGDSVDILRAPIALGAPAEADDNTGYTYAIAVEGVSSGNAAETVFRSELRIQ